MELVYEWISLLFHYLSYTKHLIVLSVNRFCIIIGLRRSNVEKWWKFHGSDLSDRETDKDLEG